MNMKTMFMKMFNKIKLILYRWFIKRRNVLAIAFIVCAFIGMIRLIILLA